MTNTVFRGIGTDKSSIKNMGTNALGALVFVLTPAIAWIPIVGYFAWVIPLVILFMEKKSLLLRFYCAEALMIGMVRLLFDVVFNSIADVAKQTVELYGQDPNFFFDVTNPGNGALLIGGIFAGILTVISLGLALCAYFRIPVRIPGTAPLCRSIAEFRFKGSK